jgi:uncharacterized membrane protein YjfL (UPF0719 family)
MTDQSSSPTSSTPTHTSTLALVSLVTGILSWVFLPLIGPIIAIITGHMARSEIRRSNGLLTGAGMALAGLILGYVQIFLIIIPLCLITILALLGPVVGDVFSNIISDI